MASRYDDRVIYENTEEAHEELRESRGLKKIVHYNTATLGTISSDKYENISVISHTWSVGDRFYKLSYQYYGSTKYWWVIVLAIRMSRMWVSLVIGANFSTSTI